MHSGIVGLTRSTARGAAPPSREGLETPDRVSAMQSLGVVLRDFPSSCGMLSAFSSFADPVPG